MARSITAPEDAGQLEKRRLHNRVDAYAQSDLVCLLVGVDDIELELLVWIEGIRPSTKSNLLILIYDTLSANGIAMPYPQLDLHIKDKRILNKLR